MSHFKLEKIKTIDFLNSIAKKYNILEPKDWGNITKKQLIEDGGKFLFTNAKSPISILSNIFPEITWKKEWWKIRAKGHWKENSNKIHFLEKIKIKYNIKNPQDWGKLSTRMIAKSGGSCLLRKYNNSLHSCLKQVYPGFFSSHGNFINIQKKEIEWKRDWFRTSPNHWSCSENQKLFLEDFAKKHNFQNFSDWGNIGNSTLKKEGGSSFLRNNSIRNLLQCHFPNVSWKTEWWDRLPKKYWKNPENQRMFLDKIAKELGIKTPSDWANISIRSIYKLGGGTLAKYFNNSLFKCLQSVYKEINWKREWFPMLPKSPIRPRGYWNSLDNRRKFFFEISESYNIKSEKDWNRVSFSLINAKGGRALLLKYGNSIQLALSSTFPDAKWNINNTTEPQMKLKRLIELGVNTLK